MLSKKPFLFVLILAALGAWPPSAARAQSVVGLAEYYVLGDEEDIIDAYQAIPVSGVPGGATGADLRSQLSIVSSADGVKLYIDWHEDGYYFNPAMPTATADFAFTLNRGQFVALTDASTTEGGPNGVDGGDRIFIAGAPVSMVRTIFPQTPGSFIADAWELYPTVAWQDAYTVPVGIDVDHTIASSAPVPHFPAAMPPDPFLPFQFTFAFYTVEADDTEVLVVDPNMGIVFSETLDQGQSGFVSNVVSGTRIIGRDANDPNAPRRIQASIITSTNENVDSRFYTLTPELLLGSEYYLPVPSMRISGNEPQTGPGQPPVNGFVTTASYIYSFQDNTAIEVETALGVTPVTLDRGELFRFVMPEQPGVANFNDVTNPANVGGPYAAYVRAVDPNDKIWVLTAGDDERPDLDWGYQSLSADLLADVYYLPLALANPVYVTPTVDGTTFFVDFDNDGVNDQIFTLNRFSMRRIYDPDTNASGARVAATSPFALAWGQDNTQQSPGETLPDFDYGYTVLPLNFLEPRLSIEKTASPTDLFPNASPTPQDTTTFTIVVQALNGPAFNVDISDHLPAGWVFVDDSATITFSDGSPMLTGNAADPIINGLDLDWDLTHDLVEDATITIVFTGQATGSALPGYNINEACALATDIDVLGPDTQFFAPCDTAVVRLADLLVTKSSDTFSFPVVAGQTINYQIDIANVSSAPVTDIDVEDFLPSNLTFVPSSTSITAPGLTAVRSVFDDFNPAAYNGNDGTPGGTNWTGAWTEMGDDGSAGGGTIRVSSGAVVFGAAAGGSSNKSIFREANLLQGSGGTPDSAFLSFDYRRINITSGNFIAVEVSVDNGGVWNPVTSFTAGSDTGFLPSGEFDISAFIDTDTQVRFLASPAFGTNAFAFDNVRIQFGVRAPVTTPGGAAPNLGTIPELLPNETATIMFSATVDPIANNDCPGPIVNEALVYGNGATQPVSATVSDDVQNFFGISVFEDLNGNGERDLGEPGRGAVDLTILRDDGSTPGVVDGTDTGVTTLTTDIAGNATFFTTETDGTFLVAADRTDLPLNHFITSPGFQNQSTGLASPLGLVTVQPFPMMALNNCAFVSLGFRDSPCVEFPEFTDSPVDGKFISIAGSELETLVDEELHFIFAVDDMQNSALFGIFDGDCGKDSLGALNWEDGYWDYKGSQGDTPVGTLPGMGNELVYELYADPDKDLLTPNVLLATWRSDTVNAVDLTGRVSFIDGPSMFDNNWWNVLVETGPEAQAPSLNYFYRLVIRFRDPVANDLWCNFKLRTSGASVSVAGGQVLAFAAPLVTEQDFVAMYPVFPGPSVYNGEWNFAQLIPNPLTSFDVWNGDFDYGNAFGTPTFDTDDPNTAPTDRPPATGLSGTERDEDVANSAAVVVLPDVFDPDIVGVGQPPDNSEYDAWRVGADIGLQLVVPTATPTTLTDANPSGNREWELFQVSTTGTADAAATPLPMGTYIIRVTGLDFTNLTFLYFAEETFACDPTIGGISRPFEPLRVRPSSIEGRVGLDADKDGALEDGEPGLRGLTVRLQGAQGDGTLVDLETIADAEGRYGFRNLEPGRYSISTSGAYFRQGFAPLGGNIRQVLLEWDDARESVDFAFRQSAALIETHEVQTLPAEEANEANEAAQDTRVPPSLSGDAGSRDRK
jgi:uncharacterized repeat protein (TIGR01451 family)